MSQPIKYADLFAGVGGFAAAMTMFDFSHSYAIEIDKQAANVYEKNWGLSPLGDITEHANEFQMLVPENDILLGGFPCQPFSKSGTQRGMEETRGTLFWNILRILETRRPTVLVLENVRNLAGPRHVHEWEVIISSLRQAGYVVSSKPAILSPHRLPPHLGGRPQNRERVFITGTYAPDLALELDPEPVFGPKSEFDGWDPGDWNLNRDFEFEKKADSDYSLSSQEVLWISAWEEWLQTFRANNGSNPPGFPLWSDEWSDNLSIKDGEPTWKVDFLTKNYELYKANKSWIDPWFKKWNIRSEKFPASRRKFEWQAGDTESLWNTLMHFRPSGLRAKRTNYFPTLVAITQTSIYGPLKRRLTPRETARLQAFPESFVFGDQPDAAAYKQMGNAVNVNVVYQVFRAHCLRDSDLLKQTVAGSEILKSVLKSPENPDDKKTRF